MERADSGRPPLWPARYSSAAARTFLEEDLPKWARRKGRELGRFPDPVVALDSPPGCDDVGTVEAPSFRIPLPQMLPWMRPPMLRSHRIPKTGVSEGLAKEPVCEVLLAAAWVARRQALRHRMEHLRGARSLASAVDRLHDTLHDAVVETPDLVLNREILDVLRAAQTLRGLRFVPKDPTLRNQPGSLQRLEGVDPEMLPSKLAWELLFRAGLGQRRATISLLALGLVEPGETTIGVVERYESLGERIRRAWGRESFPSAIEAHLGFVAGDSGPADALEGPTATVVGKARAGYMRGLMTWFVYERAATSLGIGRAEVLARLSAEAGAPCEPEATGPEPSSPGFMRLLAAVPLEVVGGIVVQARQTAGLGPLRVAGLEALSFSGLPGVALAHIIRQEAGIQGVESPTDVDLVLAVSRRVGAGAALQVLSAGLQPLEEACGEPVNPAG